MAGPPWVGAGPCVRGREGGSHTCSQRLRKCQSLDAELGGCLHVPEPWPYPVRVLAMGPCPCHGRWTHEEGASRCSAVIVQTWRTFKRTLGGSTDFGKE